MYPYQRVGAGATPLSRRALLGIVGAGSIAAAVGCSVDTGTTKTGGSNPKAIKFPDYSTKLPAGSATLRWVDSGDLKSVWEQSILDAFTKKHPNIKTQYDGNGWDEVNRVVPLGIRNKSAPDVFAMPQDVPPQIAINQGWIQPLDELVPDFESWRANFPQTALVPGVNIFNDKLYSWPMNSARRLDRMLMGDTAVMKGAGYDDLSSQITTWDELTEALTKVKASGKGGLMVGGDGLAGIVSFLAWTAGWHGVGGNAMDMRSGEYAYTAPEIEQAYELMHKFATDKLIVPGYLNLLEKDARAQMTAGKAGLIFNGPWDIPAWKKAAPDWKYSISAMPSPEGKPYNVPFLEGSNSFWVYADTKLASAVGQIVAYMGSPEGQKMMVILSEGNLQSLQPEANKAADQPGLLDVNAKRAVELAKESMRIAPRAELRNPDVAKVAIELQPVSPNFNEVMQGLLSGQLKNPRQQFAKLNASLEAALEKAIAAAKKKGSTVTRDDYKFDNWDPSKDYTDADYKALGSS